MNSFIRHITGSDERLIMLARLHWIYLLKGISLLASLTCLGVWLDRLLWRISGFSAISFDQGIIELMQDVPLTAFLFLGGLFIFFIYLIKYLATEIALTNQRIIYKTGLIFVEVEEIDLVEIRAERVHHGLLGRFLGYGHLKLDSRFVGDINLPAIRKPYRLIKAMHSARARLSDVPM